MSYRNFLRLVFVIIVVGGCALVMFLSSGNNLPQYGFKLVKTYQHDPDFFTQGIFFDRSGDYYYEGSGLRGKSRIRKVELESGKVIVERELPETMFGEGIVEIDGKVYQGTWQENTIFVYDMDLNLLETRTLEEEMWGLATDGRSLIFSNGSHILTFVDPKTMTIERRQPIRFGRSLANQMNELEFAGGKLFANRYLTDLVYEIDLKSGDVTSVIDLSGLWPTRDRPRDGVLNGLAHSPKKQMSMFVTGKNCPNLYEVEFVPKK
jgi:glutamine cyclotransferase